MKYDRRDGEDEDRRYSLKRVLPLKSTSSKGEKKLKELARP
jgi:hypothetical protein